MVRVCYVSHTGLMSGAELSLVDLVENLPATHEATVASPAGPLLEATSRLGIDSHELPPIDGALGSSIGEGLAFARQTAAYMSALHSTISAQAPDIIHANSTRAGMLVQAALPARRPPLCTHVRDVVVPRYVGRQLSRGFLKRADRVLFVSDYVRRQFDDARQIQGDVVYNAVDVTRLRATPEAVSDFRARAELPGDALVLLLPAQRAEWKGHLDAVRTLANVRRANDQVMLVFAGETKDITRRAGRTNAAFDSRLRAEIARLNLTHAVKHVGHISDMAAAYACATAVLVPSHVEPFGRAVLEGMAAQRPTIATSIGGPAEIISNWTDGILLPPRNPDLWADAIIQLLASPPARLRLGSCARRTVEERFTMHRYVASCLMQYERAGQSG